MRRYRAETAVILGLVVTTLALFWPACGAEFVNYDDQEYVYENPRVLGGLGGASAWWALTTFHAANWHPLTWLSLQLDASLFGPGPFGFHLTSVLLHAANAALLFCALRLLTGALWRSAFVAALFALHPLHVESVAWVAERKDVLCALFFMLTLLAYGWYARGPGWRRYLPVALALALGLLAKPMLVTLPFVLLLLDYWPLRRLDAGWRALVLEKLPLFVLSALSCLLTWQAQQRSGAIGSLESYSLGARLGNAVLAYAAYLGGAFWPVGLAAHYPHPGEMLPAWQVAGAAVILAAATGLAVLLRRQAPYVPVGWLWFLGMLVPVIGIVQVGYQARADRYTYLPLIGIFLLVTWGAAELGDRMRLPRPALGAAAVAALAVCVVCTRTQLGYWHDSLALWRHTLAVAPSSGYAHYALGSALERQDQVREAIAHYESAVRLNPKHAMAHNNLGNALDREGRRPEAVRCYQEALRVDPGCASAHNNLAATLQDEGRLQEAITHYREAVRLAPGFAVAHYNLAAVLESQGQRQEAALHYQAALRLDPRLAAQRTGEAAPGTQRQ